MIIPCVGVVFIFFWCKLRLVLWFSKILRHTFWSATKSSPILERISTRRVIFNNKKESVIYYHWHIKITTTSTATAVAAITLQGTNQNTQSLVDRIQFVGVFSCCILNIQVKRNEKKIKHFQCICVWIWMWKKLAAQHRLISAIKCCVSVWVCIFPVWIFTKFYWPWKFCSTISNSLQFLSYYFYFVCIFSTWRCSTVAVCVRAYAKTNIWTFLSNRQQIKEERY